MNSYVQRGGNIHTTGPSFFHRHELKFQQTLYWLALLENLLLTRQLNFRPF